MVQFRVRASSLGEVAANLQSVIAVFDGHVASTSNVVGSVADVSWRGEDATAFLESWALWQQQADLVRLSLTTLAGQLVAAEAGYTTTEGGLVNASTRERQEDRVVVANVAAVHENVEDGLEYAAGVVAPTLVGISGGGAATRVGRGNQQTEQQTAQGGTTSGTMRFGGAAQSQQAGPAARPAEGSGADEGEMA